ncbi:UNVERIFIED_CONTAM: hypothetical protein NCL1_50507 [Trichonephila clavipes]
MDLCTTALFLSAKINEKPGKLEHVIKTAHSLLHRYAQRLDDGSEMFSCDAIETPQNRFQKLLLKKCSEELDQNKNHEQEGLDVSEATQLVSYFLLLFNM